jgi:hypothetical protein
LRAENPHPRVARDDHGPPAGPAGTSFGRHIVFVPEDEEARARAVLREPVRDEPEDNPVLRLVLIVGLITPLLFATPFAAQVCSGSL